MKKITSYLSLLIIIVFIGSCSGGIFCIAGEGERFTEERTVEDFNAIRSEINAKVYIIQSEKNSVEIVAQQNILDNIKITVTNNEIIISQKRCANNYDSIEIFISTKSLNKITMKGSGEIFMNNRFEAEDLDLIIDGSGNINFSDIFISKQLITQINGSGNVNLAGRDSIKLHTIDIAGSGNVNAFGLLTKQTKVQISGSGNVNAWAIEKLDVNITGSGNVYYKGNPDIYIDNTGSGIVINSN